MDRSKVSWRWVAWRRPEHGLEKREGTSVEDAGCIRNVEPLVAYEQYEQLAHASLRASCTNHRSSSYQQEPSLHSRTGTREVSKRERRKLK